MRPYTLAVLHLTVKTDNMMVTTHLHVVCKARLRKYVNTTRHLIELWSSRGRHFVLKKWCWDQKIFSMVLHIFEHLGNVLRGRYEVTTDNNGKNVHSSTSVGLTITKILYIPCD